MAAAVGVQLIFTHPLESIEKNIRGTQNILAAAQENNAKVFVASTSEVYGKDTTSQLLKFAETDAITLGSSMRWCYACSKAMDEYIARAYHSSKGLPVVIGRLFNTVGPRQSPAYGMVIPRFVQSALVGTPIQVYGDGLQKRTFNHVLDTVRGIRGLMQNESALGEVFNIGGVEVISILDLAKRIRDLTGSKSEIQIIPYEQAYGPGFEDIRNRVPDISKIGNLLGYKPRFTLDDVLRDTVKAMSR
jgi:UDP-glucose 4-epimerase